MRIFADFLFRGEESAFSPRFLAINEYANSFEQIHWLGTRIDAAVSGQIPELFMRLYDQIRKLGVNPAKRARGYRRAFALGIFTARVLPSRPRGEHDGLRNALYLCIRVFTPSLCNQTRFRACH